MQYIKSLPEGTTDSHLVENIEDNARRYVDVFSDAIDEIMPKETREVS